MKKSLILLCAALLVLSCVSVFAAEAHKGATSKPHSTHVMGEVVSVDAASNSFVVR